MESDHMPVSFELGTVPDDELLLRLGELVAHSHRVEAELVAHIGEVDGRRLYARQAFPSMFAYCTQALHLSEAEAYRRITVARAARRHPLLLAVLRDGRVHLSGLARLVPLLTPKNCEALLARATHRTTRQIEELVAEFSPRPDAPSLIRRLPDARQTTSQEKALDGRGDGSPGELVPGRVVTLPLAHSAGSPTVSSEAKGDDATATSSIRTPPTGLLPRPSIPAALPTPPSPALLVALSPGRHRVQFTASDTLREKLERLTALMRSEVPDGDLAAILERAVTEKLERLEARRFAKTAAPRKSLPASHSAPATRRIPAAVRRAVVARDGSRCAFVDPQGRRCAERHRLEFHHRHPFGMGGDHSLGNVGLLCAAHNRHLAELDYSQTKMDAAAARQRTLPHRGTDRTSEP